MAISTANFADLLEPGFAKIFAQSYVIPEPEPDEMQALFDLSDEGRDGQ